MKRPFFVAYCHPDILRYGDGTEVGFAFWPRRNPPLGEYAYRVMFSVSFRLPKFRLKVIHR